jgi:fatty-acyl-CoA synthase
VAVVGVPHAEYGEEVVAFIQLREGKSVTVEEIKQFCRDHIARYKTPQHIFFVEVFPMTASGKIQKYVLRDIARAQVGATA